MRGRFTGTLADGRVVRFVGNPYLGRILLMVDARALDDAWRESAAHIKDHYIPPGGGGAEIVGRRQGFLDFLATGRRVEASRVAFTNPGGFLGFEDGRPRFRVLCDLGI